MTYLIHGMERVKFSQTVTSVHAGRISSNIGENTDHIKVTVDCLLSNPLQRCVDSLIFPVRQSFEISDDANGLLFLRQYIHIHLLQLSSYLKRVNSNCIHLHPNGLTPPPPYIRETFPTSLRHIGAKVSQIHLL